MAHLKKMISLMLVLLFIIQLLPMRYLGLKTIEAFAAETTELSSGYEFEVPKEADNTVTTVIPETIIEPEGYSYESFDPSHDNNNEIFEGEDTLVITEEYSATATSDEEPVNPLYSPYYYSSNESEIVSLNTGELSIETVDYVLPGKNGLDLVIGRRYRNADAQKKDFTEHAVVDGDETRYLYYVCENNHNVDLYGLGQGWGFTFSSIEILHNDKYLQMSNGERYQLSCFPYELIGYDYTDITIETYEGDTWESLYSDLKVTYFDGRTEYFSEDGKLERIEDSYGNAITFVHSVENGYPRIDITDTLGRQIVIFGESTTNGHVMSVLLPDGNTLEYAVYEHENGLQTISSYTNVEGGTTHYSYSLMDSASDEHMTDKTKYDYLLLSTITHPTQAQTKFEYEITEKYIMRCVSSNKLEFGRVASRKDIIGNEEYNHLTYEYIDHNPKKAAPYYTIVNNSSGISIKNSFDKKHLLVSSSSYYDERLIEETSYSYDYKGYPIGESYRYYDNSGTTYRESKIWYSCIDSKTVQNYGSTLGNGLINSEYDTHYYYSPKGRLKSKTYKTNPETKIYLANTVENDIHITKSELSIEKAINGATTKNVIQTTDYTYDTYGNVLTERHWNADKTAYELIEYTYQNGAYLTQEKHSSVKTSDGASAVGTSGTADGIITYNYTYDNLGRMTSSKDGKGNTTAYTYDDLGNVTSITNPDSTTVTYTRNYTDNYVIVKDENNNQIKYTYTPLGLEYETIDVTSGNVITRKEYDSNSRLSKVYEYVYGSVTEYTYDYLDRVTSETIKQGNTVLSQTLYSYEYAVENGAYNKVTKTVVGDSNAPSVVTTEYTDKHGNVAKTGKVINGVEYFDTYTYDYVGNNTSILSAADAAKNLAHTSKYEYNHDGQVTKTYNANNQYTTNTYDAYGRMVSATDYAGTPTTYTYDTLGRLTSQTITIETGKTSTTKYEYDAAGNIIREWNQNNAVGSTADWAKTEYTYDNRNRLTSVKQYNDSTVASTTSYTYDNVGNVLTMTVGGKTTTYTYDRFGNVLTEKDALNRTESYVYSNLGKLQSKTDRNGVTTNYSYDALGRTVSVTADDEHIVYSYTHSGQIRTEENNHHQTVYSYDDVGRIKKIIEEESRTGNLDTPSDETGTSFVVILDPSGGTVSSTHMVVEVGGAYNIPTPIRTGYIFNGWYNGNELVENGDLIDITENSTFVAEWTPITYTVTFHAGGGTPDQEYVQTFTYDVAAPLMACPFTKSLSYLVGWATENVSGQNVVYSDQEIVINLASENEANIDLLATWKYGTAPTSTTANENVLITLGEDSEQVQKVSLEEVATNDNSAAGYSSSENITYTKTFTYDLADNRTGFTLAKSGQTVHNITYTYDNLNRLSTVKENGTVEATYTYDTNGNRASLTLGNGVVTTYSYNLANWVTALTNKKSNNTVLSGYTYTYYASGNQKSKTDNTGKVTSYVYDDLGRLTQESETGGVTLSYTYDAAGNRTKLTATGSENYVTNYTYNNANQLTSEVKTVGSTAQTTSYTYDNNGNMLSKTSPEGTQANTYNKLNQLVASINAGVTSSYTYNADGIRTSKTVGTTTTDFLLDGGNVVGEIEGSSLMGRYLYGLNLIYQEGLSYKSYYLFNAHGDVVNLVDGSGYIEDYYSYDAFGNEEDPYEYDLNPFRYCGEYFDKETGTYYLKARYYDPAIGRFTQQDTHWNTANMIYGDTPNKINEREDALGLKTYTYMPSINSIMQSGNLYVYGLNNPVYFTDINGEFVISATMAVVIAGAAIFGTVGGCIGNYVANEQGATGWDKAAYIGNYAAIGALTGGFIGYAAAPTIIAATGITGFSISLAQTTAFTVPVGIHATEAVGQRHHIISRQIFRALESHETLSGKIDRATSVVRVLTTEAHRGYQKWHRFIDRTMVEWLTNPDNKDATTKEFWAKMYELYSEPDVVGRFGRAALDYIESMIKK